jgi:hypothetical protein
VKKIIGAIVAAVVLIAIAGCLWTPELDAVRRDVQRQIPDARFKKEFAMSLGPVSLTIARAIVHAVPNSRDASRYLADIRRVKVAVYNVESLPERFDLTCPRTIQALIDKKGWQAVVRTHDEKQAVWILCRTKGEAITDLLVTVLDDDQMVLVRAGGRLDRLCEKAANDHFAPRHDLGLRLD